MRASAAASEKSPSQLAIELGRHFRAAAAFAFQSHRFRFGEKTRNDFRAVASGATQPQQINSMKLFSRNIAALAAVCLVSAAAFAADASGTWKWTEQSRGGGGGGGTPREVTLTLAQKDGQLSGKYSRPGRDGNTTTGEITNASIKGDTIAFNIEREFNGNKVVTKYSGKLAGDTITGQVESPGRNGGEPTKREWVAKRAK